MEEFGKVTIKQLIKRFADLHCEAVSLKARYADLEQQANGIRALVPEHLLNEGIRDLLEGSTQPPTALEAPKTTLRQRILERMKKAGEPLRPAQIVEQLLSPLGDSRQTLSGKVNAELRRMVNREDAEIEKLPKARYQLKEKGSPDETDDP